MAGEGPNLREVDGIVVSVAHERTTARLNCPTFHTHPANGTVASQAGRACQNLQQKSTGVATYDSDSGLAWAPGGTSSDW